MARGKLVFTFLIFLFLAACGGGEVVVTAEIDVDDPDGEGMMARPLEEIEVRLIPFDRDEIFDSLEAAHPEPEPEIPDSLLVAQEAVAEAQAEWREAETEWNVLRDTLQTLVSELERLNPGEGQYQVLYRDWQELEGRLAAAERRQEQAFERFTELQQGIAQQSQEIQLARDEWAAEAFADVGDVIDARLAEVNREELVDTTDASGMVTFNAPAGDWWVHARYPLPYQELYWNVPVTVSSGETHEIRISRENAEERPIL